MLQTLSEIRKGFFLSKEIRIYLLAFSVLCVLLLLVFYCPLIKIIQMNLTPASILPLNNKIFIFIIKEMDFQN